MIRYYKIFITIGLFAICKNTQAQQQVMSLTIGEDAPAIKPLKWLKGTPINKYSKGHVYILEFGASWCSPCLTMIPELSAMAEKYKGRATVASFYVMEHNPEKDTGGNPKYAQRIEKLIARQGDKIQYTIGVDDAEGSLEKAWLDAAGATGIPITFVVNQQGKIAWMGSNREQLKKVIEQIVENKYLSEIPMNQGIIKNDPTIEERTVQQQVASIAESKESDILHFSAITTFNPEQKAEIHSYVENYNWLSTDSDSAISTGKIKLIGMSLRQLYYCAYGDTVWNYPLSRNIVKGIFYDTIAAKHYRRSYGKYWYRPLLELRDSSQFETFEWSNNNKFNYWLSTSPKTSSSLNLRNTLQADLQNTFGYSVTVEKRKMPCWKLTTNPENAAALITKTPGQKYRLLRDDDGNYRVKNAEIRDLLFQLEIRYGRKTNDLRHEGSMQPPFIDHTGIVGEIDFVFMNEAAEKITDEKYTGVQFPFEEYRKLLLTMGIVLVKSECEMNVIVIRDPKGNQIP